MWNFLDRNGFSFVKIAQAAEPERPDVAVHRPNWLDGQPVPDPDKLVFIDETGASTMKARLRGRAEGHALSRNCSPWPLEDNRRHGRRKSFRYAMFRSEPTSSQIAPYVTPNKIGT